MKKYLWLAGPALAAALLLWPGTALNAARAAMHAWATSVAPSLFPFMLLMPLLTCREASRAYERLLGPVMKRLFNLPGSAAPAVVIPMFAGSPAGARAIVRAAGNAGLSAAHAERMILCLCGVGPAFLTSGIGASMLQSAADGNLLMRAQLLTQLDAVRGVAGREDAVGNCIARQLSGAFDEEARDAG